MLTIRDLSQVVTGEVPVSAGRLYDTWDADWSQLGSDVRAKDRVIAALQEVRSGAHEVLKSLN